MMFLVWESKVARVTNLATVNLRAESERTVNSVWWSLCHHRGEKEVGCLLEGVFVGFQEQK